MVPSFYETDPKEQLSCAQLIASLIGMKQFVCAIHQHPEKRTDIHYKVIFRFNIYDIQFLFTTGKIVTFLRHCKPLIRVKSGSWTGFAPLQFYTSSNTQSK